MIKVCEGDIVRLEWVDHTQWQSGWKNLDKMLNKEHKLLFCVSAGLVVTQDKERVVLVQNWHTPQDETGSYRVSDFMVIIRSCIKKITILKKKEVEIV